MELLEARERRAARQRELLEQYRRPVISLCMNIAGPVKRSPVICRGFREGQARLSAALGAARIPVLFQEEKIADTGCEALWVADGPGRQVKALCAVLEERDGLGRLLDLDVLDREAPEGRWDRESLGFPPRPCLICGRRGRVCASRRVHPAEELQEKTAEIFRAFFARQDREHLAALAMRALLYEVSAAPKPGLVDRANNGSHRDMDLFRFLDSASALLPYWLRAVEIGQETGTVEYGRVKAIRMELGPEEDPLAENASGELVWIDPVQIEPEEQENRQDFAVEQEATLPQDPDLRAKLNGFARKVAGYYGLTGAEVTVEWKDDKGEVDSDVAGGSAADALVLSAGDR